MSEGAGARIEATHGLGDRTAISLGVSAQDVRYSHYPLQDGRSYWAAIGLLRALTPASAVNARIGTSRHTAAAPELANWSGWLSAGYYRDLAGGFSIYVEPSYAFSRYDAADPFFGKRRTDHLAQLQIALLNRRIVKSGFTPRIALTVARRYSTINLYEFTQRRLEMGFTRSF